jgi:hypothetical protein
MASPAAAISIVEPLAFGNWRTEPATGAIGGGAAIGVASLDVAPAFEWVFADNATDWAIDLDAHIPLIALPVVAFYAGAGAGFYSHDPDSGDSSTDFGVNLLVGVKASIRRLKPFGEIRYSTAGPDGVAIMIGTRFHLFD